MSYDASEPTSLSLLGRACADDQQAWRHIVHLYGPLVYRWCRRAGLQEDEASDIFQETFRSVSANLNNFKPTKSTGSFRSWLRTISRTKIADHFRRANRQPHAQGGTAAQLHLAEVPDVLPETDGEAERETSQVVQRAMELIKPEFDPRNWSAFWQIAVEGRSAVEVAAEHDVAPQTIRQANYRIRRRLRLVLQDLVDDPLELVDEAN
jgi:RNA polymerase sigma-70 factor (ECF subfamily)